MITLSIINSNVMYGNYSEALRLIDNYDDFEETIPIKSRIFELTGQFENALSIVENGLNDIKPNKNYLQSRLMVSKSYALWRLGHFIMAKANATDTINMINNVKLTAEMQLVLSGAQNILGLIYWKLGENDQALAMFHESLRLRSVLRSNEEKSYCKNNIGNTFLQLGEFDKAQSYYQQSLDIRHKLDLKPGIAASFNSFGRLYDILEEFDRAEKFHLDNLKLWLEIDNPQFVAKANRFLGSHYFKRNNTLEGLKYYKIAQKLFKSIPNVTDSKFTDNLILGIN